MQLTHVLAFLISDQLIMVRRKAIDFISKVKVVTAVVHNKICEMYCHDFHWL
jgi:hypothetical protein